MALQRILLSRLKEKKESKKKKEEERRRVEKGRGGEGEEGGTCSEIVEQVLFREH